MKKREKSFKAYHLSDYPAVDSIQFPKKLVIAYAVCGKECGNREFIVDGQSQVCQYCGKLMFRTLTQQYTISTERERKGKDKDRK